MVRERNGPTTPRYLAGFTLTAVILGGLTLFLVLVILPRRYLLSAGLRESGVSFPSRAATFHPPVETPREVIPPPTRPVEVSPGPAEAFWDKVMPLLRDERFEESLPHFRAYLNAHPGDRGAAREYAITLAHAGRLSEAIPILEDLLRTRKDRDVRLLLARAQRDLGLLDQASVQYQALLEESPGDTGLFLEWGRALAWDRRYVEAVRVLETGLEQNPDDFQLHMELAKIHFWSGNLDAADRVLAALDRATAPSKEALALQEAVRSSLGPVSVSESVKPQEETVAPTLVERANHAAAEEDFDRAASLYREALEDAQDDPAIWTAYADVLQYHLEDLEGAREALLKLEALGEAGPRLRFRLAQLDLWTGHTEDARVRLDELLSLLGSHLGEVGEGRSNQGLEIDLAEVHALLGDLYRWGGNRRLAAAQYESALALDAGNERADAGMRALRLEMEREVADFERPGFGGEIYSLSDSDEFSWLDLGAAGTRMDGPWVWNMRSGSRWMQGSDLLGPRAIEQGFFLELESARWWNWGTLRSGLHVAFEQMWAGRTDPTLGASLHFGDLGGFRTDLQYDHGPAYPLTLTLQSIVAGVDQDRLQATLARRLGQRWNLSVAGDASRIGVSGNGQFDGSTTLRLESGVSVGKALNDAFILGINARGLLFTRPSPVVDGVRLFWDPRSLMAGGVYGYLEEEVTDRLTFTARLNPGVAFLRERSGSGSGTVAHLSSEAGVSHRGDQIRTNLDLFYYQGRFDGYRAFGIRLSLQATDWFGGGGDP